MLRARQLSRTLICILQICTHITKFRNYQATSSNTVIFQENMAATELRSETPSLAAPFETHDSRLNSTGIDFNFTIIHESRPRVVLRADELFSNGKLLLSQINTEPIIILPNQTHQSANESRKFNGNS